jgi:excisionase family DNA binding protein
MAMCRKLLVEEVAELLRASPETVRELVAEGRLRASRVRPRGLLFDLADVEAALQAVPAVTPAENYLPPAAPAAALPPPGLVPRPVA